MQCIILLHTIEPIIMILLQCRVLPCRSCCWYVHFAKCSMKGVRGASGQAQQSCTFTHVPKRCNTPTMNTASLFIHCKLYCCCILHCTAARAELKLGVLVNEVDSLDVDSQLLNAAHSNAAAGIKAARLAGGCACCAVSSDLDAALAELAGSSSYQELDYLVSRMHGLLA